MSDTQTETRGVAATQLVGVDGWMAWFLFGVGVQAVLALWRLPDAVSQLAGATPQVREAYPMLLPLLVQESVYPILYAGAAVYMFRITLLRRQYAPPAWGFFFIGSCLFALLHLGFSSAAISEVLTRAAGEDAAALRATASEAYTGDVRWMTWAAVWALYWQKSKRVQRTFGRVMVEPRQAA